MAKSVEELHEKLMDEYGQVRRKFDQIHTAFDRVITAGPEDDLHDRLLHLEKGSTFADDYRVIEPLGLADCLAGQASLAAEVAAAEMTPPTGSDVAR